MGTDYFDYGLTDPPAEEMTDWSAIVNALEKSQGARRRRLEEERTRIDQQLTGRDRLHQDLVDELEEKIAWYTRRLEHLYSIGKGRLDGTRDHLKDRISEFAAELRAEQRDHWRDCQDLEQSRRDLERELADLEDSTLADLI